MNLRSNRADVAEEFTEMETKTAGDGTMQQQQVKTSGQKVGGINIKDIKKVQNRNGLSRRKKIPMVPY